MNKTIIWILIFAGIILSMPQSLSAADEAKNRLQKIKNLMDDAASGKNSNVTYIVSGDSTRDSTVAGQEYIYKTMLAQVNVKYVHNARSGLRAYQWVRNSVPDASLGKAIANTKGNGENTIMEFSLGINDKNAYSRAETKENLLSSIKKYLKAKPKANVFLVVPVTHQTDFQKEWPKLYTEIAEQLKLPLINKERIMYDAFYDQENRFYYDNTHPNYFGALRMTKYILDSISGPVAKSKFKWNKEFFTGSKAESSKKNLAEGKKIKDKSWYWPHNDSPTIKGGSIQSHPFMRTLEPITVNGNSLLKIEGDSLYSASMIDKDGKLVYTFSIPKWKKHKISYIYVPPEIKEIKITLNKAKDNPLKNRLKLTYLKDGALASLTEKDIYYKNI